MLFREREIEEKNVLISDVLWVLVMAMLVKNHNWSSR